MPTRYYKVHGGRVTFREYWNLAPDPFTFLIVAGAKLFGGLPFNFSIPRIDRLEIVDLEDLPGGPRRIIRRGVQKFEDCGYELAFVHEIPVLERDRFGAAAILLAPDGVSFANVNFTEDKAASQYVTGVNCRFDDGTFGMLTTQKEQLKPNPIHRYVRLPGSPPEELVDRFPAQLEEWEAEGVRAVKLTPKTLPGLILEGEQAEVDYHAERGVIVPMTPAEVARIRRRHGGDDDEYDEDRR